MGLGRVERIAIFSRSNSQLNAEHGKHRTRGHYDPLFLYLIILTRGCVNPLFVPLSHLPPLGGRRLCIQHKLILTGPFFRAPVQSASFLESADYRYLL